MKVRAGFVSNSSSSSFYVAFPKGSMETYKKKVADFQRLIFGKAEFLQGGWDEGKPHRVRTRTLAKNLLGIALKRTDIMDLYAGSFYAEDDTIPEDIAAFMKKFEHDYERSSRNILTTIEFYLGYQRMKAFIEKAKGQDVYEFEVGDSHGEIKGETGYLLEQMNPFQNLPHIKECRR